MACLSSCHLQLTLYNSDSRQVSIRADGTSIETYPVTTIDSIHIFLVPLQRIFNSNYKMTNSSGQEEHLSAFCAFG
eukprot:1162886-Ditylum_brightwellii.AAC.1